MTSASASASSSSSSSSSSTDTTVMLPACRHLKINTQDPSIVKHLLDEQAAMFVLDQGYIEDVSLSNLKLSLGVICILFCLVGNIYPATTGLSPTAPFNSWFIKICVVAFFLIQGILQIVHWIVEKDCILLTKLRIPPQPVSPSSSSSSAQSSNKNDKTKGNDKKKKKNAASVIASDPSSSSTASTVYHTQPTTTLQVGLEYRSQLPLPPYPISLQASMTRYETEYTLTITTRQQESIFTPLMKKLFGSAPSSPLPVIPTINTSVNLDVTHYFDVNGVFLMDRYHATMREFLQQYIEQAEKNGNNQQKEE